MWATLFLLILSVLPFKQTVNNTERVCFVDGYFVINWQASPLTLCDILPGTPAQCYLLNPLDTAVRSGDPFVRVFSDDAWLYDMGTCWKR